MRCVNCEQEFESKGKGYKRTSFISEKRSEEEIKDVLDIEITPKSSKDSRFLCPVCEKLLKSASEGQQSKKELFKRTGESSYISRKRKLELSTQPSPKIRKTTKSISRVYAFPKRLLSDKVLDPPDLTPPIPEYVDRGKDEPIKEKKARLLYQSRKRGMTENCLLLSTFAASHLDKLTEEQLTLYDSLINKVSNDWELYYWMTGNKPTPKEHDNSVMDMLKEHAKNENRDVRLQQPALY